VTWLIVLMSWSAWAASTPAIDAYNKHGVKICLLRTLSMCLSVYQMKQDLIHSVTYYATTDCKQP
jgi:hypothetical protein